MADCEEYLNTKVIPYCNDDVLFQRFTKLCCHDIIATLRLLVRRPLERFYSAGPPPEDGFDILDTGTDILERSLSKRLDMSFAPWSWKSWIKWFVLAAVLAECSVQVSGARADKAWSVAEASFNAYDGHVDDELVWRSIKRLMRKARLARVNHVYNQTLIQLDPAEHLQWNDQLVTRNHPEMNQVQINSWQQDNLPALTVNEDGMDLGVGLPVNGMDGPTSYHNTHELSASVMNAEPGDATDMSWLSWESFVQDMGSSSEDMMLGLMSSWTTQS